MSDRYPPSSWWNKEADRCLLIGCNKHGYGHYQDIAQDESLCFVKMLQNQKELAALEGAEKEDVQIDDKSGIRYSYHFYAILTLRLQILMTTMKRKRKV